MEKQSETLRTTAPEAAALPRSTGSRTGHTPQQRQRAIDRLHAEGCSCVIRNGDTERSFRERGVKDLYRLLRQEPELLAGAFVADKVVGKAAAALMLLGGIAELYTDVASRPALDLLRTAGVPVRCTLEVPRIVNRTGTGWCPLETRCYNLPTPEACLAEIEAFLLAPPAVRELVEGPGNGSAPDTGHTAAEGIV